MGGIFSECSSLKELNLDKFIINNVTNITEMFRGCPEEIKSKFENLYKKNNKFILRNLNN